MNALIIFGITLSFALSGNPPHTVFFPEMPPVTTETVDVVDATSLSPDGKLLAATLQGLVNRDEARLYLILAPWDHFWLEHLVEERYISGYNALSLSAALEKYERHINTVIQYDPALPASINIATMMAAVENGVVTGQDLDVEWTASAPTINLRERWESNADAYEWAFEHLFPKMNPAILACYHPTACSHHLRDYLVSRKVFHFWVTSEAHAAGPASDFAAEKIVAEKILAATPPNIPVLGFWYSGVDPGLDEYTGVGLAGEYGKITVVSDWASNLSFLGGVTADIPKAVAAYHARLTTEPPALDPDKVYLCFDIVESGDAPSYVQSRQTEVWQDSMRGTIPINWSLGPAIFDLAPPIAAYYYNQATANDYLYMAISGAGYCHPYRGLFSKVPNPDAAWSDYLRITRQYLERMRCGDVGLYTDAWKPYKRERHDAIVKRFRDGLASVDAFVLGMGRDDNVSPNQANYFLDDNDTAIVSHIMTRWPTDYGKKTREENIEWLVNDIRAYTPTTRPGFFHVMALSWVFGPAEIAEAARQLGDDYVPLTIPQFNRLFRLYNKEKIDDN